MDLRNGLKGRAGQPRLMVPESGSVASVPCIRFDEVSGWQGQMSSTNIC